MKPAGFFKYALGIDCETSGLQFGNYLKPYETFDGGYYQAVSWGVQVIEIQTLKKVDELYLEIQWDGVSEWNSKAESVHGLSKQYLKEHGISEVQAVEEIGSLIMNYWGGISNLSCMGHNVATFDIPFLYAMFARHGIELKFSARQYDTNTLGMICAETYNSNDLFESFGIAKRDTHNALDDINYEVECARLIKNIFKIGLSKV
jgi:oligoribonuclease (3'-5' exoribonuclease)